MRIGLINVNGAIPFSELVEQVVQADRDGFDHFWFAHLPFNGYDALMINDTSFMRNLNYHEPTDTIDTLDFEKMAAVVDASYQAIVNLDS